MRNKAELSTRLAVVLPAFALLVTGVGMWSCTAEFEVDCPAGTSQTAGGGDVNDACTRAAGSGGAGGSVSSGSAGGGQAGAPPGGGGAGDAGSGEGGGAGLGGGGSGGGATAFVRFAHLSPDAPAFDVCLSANGAFDEPPVLKAAGLASGLAYQKVSAYLRVKAGRTLVRLVAAGSSRCSEGLPGLTEATLEDMGAGTYFTVGSIGKVTPAANQASFKMVIYEDRDPTADSAGKLEHRIINAVVDVATTRIEAFLGRRPLPQDVGDLTFGAVSKGQVNNKGYIEIGPQEVNAHRNPIKYFVESPTVNSGQGFMFVDAPTGPSGAAPTKLVTTAFFLGAVRAPTRSDNVLVCDDSSSAVQGALLTSCSLVAQLLKLTN